MRLEPSDPDIETVVTRIQRGDINLQPEFQRGEVWSRSKQQRLVDSILRDWHIPPIHVIELKDTRKQEVLDGQQRLAAIRDFVRGDFVVDGTIEPIDPEIQRLNGVKFRDLPDHWKRTFNQFTLRVFRIVDYRPEEPGELFFRLNQPTSLTAAEQRNAFFGPIRTQIKSLVLYLGDRGVDKELVGFSNSRMAYDDIIARVAVTVERNTIAEKLTAGDLVKAYRSESQLTENTIKWVKTAIDLIGGARPIIVGHTNFNKATFYSWLLFAIRGKAISEDQFTSRLLGEYLKIFESNRLATSLGFDELGDGNFNILPRAKLFSIYEDRASARVADVSSVVLRDVTIWLEFDRYVKSATEFPITKAKIERLHHAVQTIGSPLDDESLARSVIESGWGVLI